MIHFAPNTATERLKSDEETENLLREIVKA